MNILWGDWLVLIVLLGPAVSLGCLSIGYAIVMVLIDMISGG